MPPVSTATIRLTSTTSGPTTPLIAAERSARRPAGARAGTSAGLSGVFSLTRPRYVRFGQHSVHEGPGRTAPRSRSRSPSTSTPSPAGSARAGVRAAAHHPVARAASACVRGVPRILALLDRARRSRPRSSSRATPPSATRTLCGRSSTAGPRDRPPRLPAPAQRQDRRAAQREEIEGASRRCEQPRRRAARVPLDLLGDDPGDVRAAARARLRLRLELHGRRPAVLEPAASGRSSSCRCTGRSTTGRASAGSTRGGNVTPPTRSRRRGSPSSTAAGPRGATSPSRCTPR